MEFTRLRDFVGLRGPDDLSSSGYHSDNSDFSSSSTTSIGTVGNYFPSMPLPDGETPAIYVNAAFLRDVPASSREDWPDFVIRRITRAVPEDETCEEEDVPFSRLRTGG